MAGIDWAISNDMDIINMSLGSSYYSETLELAVDKAYDSGILVVAAAGNTGTADTAAQNVDYPAKSESVIAVAATDKDNLRAYFSSTGTEIEVSAPGVNIKSTYLNKGYATMSGTSMATPIVAGDLALLKQANPTLTNTEIRVLLDKNVLDLGADDVGGLIIRNNIYGFGLIQAQ